MNDNDVRRRLVEALRPFSPRPGVSQRITGQLLAGLRDGHDGGRTGTKSAVGGAAVALVLASVLAIAVAARPGHNAPKGTPASAGTLASDTGSPTPSATGGSPSTTTEASAPAALGTAAPHSSASAATSPASPSPTYECPSSAFSVVGTLDRQTYGEGQTVTFTTAVTNTSAQTCAAPSPNDIVLDSSRRQIAVCDTSATTGAIAPGSSSPFPPGSTLHHQCKWNQEIFVSGQLEPAPPGTYYGAMSWAGTGQGPVEVQFTISAPTPGPTATPSPTPLLHY